MLSEDFVSDDEDFVSEGFESFDFEPESAAAVFFCRSRCCRSRALEVDGDRVEDPLDGRSAGRTGGERVLVMRCITSKVWPSLQRYS